MIKSKIKRYIITKTSARLCYSNYNQFHNILRLFDALPNFPFATSETMGEYYL